MADVTATFAAKDQGVAAMIQRLENKLSGFQSRMSAVSASAKGMQETFSGLAKTVVGLAAAYIGVSQAIGAFNEAVALGGELDDLTKRTGMAAGDIMLLQKAFELGGASAGSVGPTIDRLRRAIVAAGNTTSVQAQAFEELGINIEDLRRQSPTEQLRRTAEAIMAIGDDARRTALAVALFGKSGGELVPLFSNFSGELAKAQGYLGSTPRLMSRMAGTLADLGDNLTAIAKKGRDFMLGVLSKIAPDLVKITNQIAQIDAAALGEIVGGWIKRFGEFLARTFDVVSGLERVKLAIENMAQGNIGAGLELLFKSVRNWGLNAVNEIVAGAQAGISTIWQTLQDLFRGDGPTFKMLGALFDYIELKLIAAIGRAMANLPAFLGGGAGHLRAAAMDEETAQMALGRAAGFGGQALADMARIASQTTDRFTANMANAARPFDMTAREAEVQAITDKMIAPTLDKARELFEKLQTLMAREPASPERRAQEAELIRAIRELQTNGISTDAINRLSEEMSRNAMPQATREEMARQASASAMPATTQEEVASEPTLKRAVDLLAELNTKLPQPVLV